MDTYSGIICAAIFVFLMGGLVVAHVFNKRGIVRRRHHLQLRPIQPLPDWYAGSYRAVGAPYSSALAIADRLARRLGCHVTQILASDRFDDELSIGGFAFLGLDDDDDMEEFCLELEEMLGKAVYQEPLRSSIQKAETVGQLVQACDEFFRTMDAPRRLV